MIAVSVLVVAIPEGTMRLLRVAFGGDTDFGLLLFQDVPRVKSGTLVVGL